MSGRIRARGAEPEESVRDSDLSGVWCIVGLQDSGVDLGVPSARHRMLK